MNYGLYYKRQFRSLHKNIPDEENHYLSGTEPERDPFAGAAWRSRWLTAESAVDVQRARLELRQSVRLVVNRRFHRRNQSRHHREGILPELLVAQAGEGRGGLLFEKRAGTDSRY